MKDVRLRVDSEDTDPTRLNRMTTSLYDDLRALGMVNVGRPEGPTAPGGKSGPAGSIAELVLTGTLSAATVTAVYKVIVAYLERTKARSITWIEDGKQVVVTALSAKDQRAMVELLAARMDDGKTER